MNRLGKAVVIFLALLCATAFGWWLSLQMSHPKSVMQPSIPNPAMSLAENELWISELDASLRVVSETLATTGNLTAAISMLEVLEARVARSDTQGRLGGLGRALRADREKLLAIRGVDLAGIATGLDELSAQIDKLPLISQRPIAAASSPAQVPAAINQSVGLFDQILQGVRERLSEVVRIRRIENPDALFLTPEQGALIAERLRLRLISARVALMSRQDILLAKDLSEAEKILSQAFDGSDAAVMAAKSSLQSIRQSAGRLVTPKIEQSLLAMETLRVQAAPAKPTQSPSQ